MFKHLKLLVRRLVPAGLLSFLRVIPYYFIEFFQSAPPTQGAIAVPPLWKMFDGPRNKDLFVRNSEEALGVYKTYGRLNPDSHVLDIGCGLGRKTLSLPDYLSAKGQYVGVDIVRKGIDWCNDNIAARHTNFTFVHLNVFNARYNRRATVKASEYRFPFGEKSFDLVTAWSVFTHMLPADVKNYLRETSRMLTPDGRCIFSFYIMNEKAISAVKNGTALEKIDYEIDDQCFTDNKNVPEDLTAFGEAWIRAAFQAAGLEVENILFGSWVGDGEARKFPMANYQDIIIARRP